MATNTEAGYLGIRHWLNAHAPQVLATIVCPCLTILLSGCAATQAPNPQNENLIKRLQVAEALDRENAAASPDLAEAHDSLRAAVTADHALREIQHGYTASTDELHDALDVPPRTIGDADRVQLIKELKEAKQEDEGHLTATFHEGPARDAYAAQAYEVDQVVKDLEIGEAVPWSRIRDALKIPYSP